MSLDRGPTTSFRLPFTNSCPFLLDYFRPLSFFHFHIHHFLPRRVLGVAWWQKGVHPHLCHRLNFNTPLAKSHGKSFWSSRSECSLFQSAVFQLCNGHTRLCKLNTHRSERAVSIARTGERAQIDIRFPSSLQSKPFKRSSYFAWGGTKYDMCFLEGVWSDHYKLQPYDNANNARSKTEASSFKAKIKRLIET